MAAAKHNEAIGWHSLPGQNHDQIIDQYVLKRYFGVLVDGDCIAANQTEVICLEYPCLLWP